MLRFGQITQAIDRSFVNDELDRLLWKYDKITFILNKIGIFDEIQQAYNWVMIFLVNNLITNTKLA